jgi:hypothetical protein
MKKCAELAVRNTASFFMRGGKSILERIVVYCPATVYLFKDHSLDDFYASDLDEQNVWEDAKAEKQTDYLGTLNVAMFKYGYNHLPLEPTLSNNFSDILSRVSQIDLMLEIHNDSIWLAAYCSMDKPLQENDMPRLKEYLAERIVSETDMVSQWGFTEQDPDVLAVSFDAVDTITPSCSYSISYDELLKSNHLLLKSELNAGSVSPMQEAEASPIQSL